MNATATKSAETARVRTEDLRNLLKHSVPSQDQTRTHLQTLRFEGLRTISTDGHRLHQLPSPGGLIGLEATVPVWALEAAIASLAGSESFVSIIPEGNHVRLTTTAGTITAEQPQFPPYRQVYPRGEVKVEFEVPLAPAIRELSRLRKAAGHETNVILSGVRILGEHESRDVTRVRAGKITGKLEEPFPPAWDIDSPGWHGQVGFQADYLLDAFRAAKGAQIAAPCRAATLRIYGEHEPAALDFGTGDALLMPCRI